MAVVRILLGSPDKCGPSLEKEKSAGSEPTGVFTPGVVVDLPILETSRAEETFHMVTHTWIGEAKFWERRVTEKSS